jgi:hypothetical protein
VRRVGGPPIERTFTIHNLTTQAMQVTWCMGPNLPFEALGTCPASIPAGGTLDQTMRFTPSDVGPALAQMIVYAPWSRDIGVTLSANVVAHRYALSAAQVGFPQILRGTTAAATITVTNLASDPVDVPVAVTGDAFARTSAPTLALAGGASVDVAIEFRPPSRGAYAGALTIGDAADPDRATLPLSGIATSPDVTCETSLDLGKVAVGARADGTIRLRNLDTAHGFTIAELSVDDAAFTADTPGDPVLAAGGAKPIAVHFAPTTTGLAQGKLSIVLAGDPVPQAVVALTGDGFVADAGGVDAGGDHGGGGGGGGCATSRASDTGALALVVAALAARPPAPRVIRARSSAPCRRRRPTRRRPTGGSRRARTRCTAGSRR